MAKMYFWKTMVLRFYGEPGRGRFAPVPPDHAGTPTGLYSFRELEARIEDILRGVDDEPHPGYVKEASEAISGEIRAWIEANTQ